MEKPRDAKSYLQQLRTLNSLIDDKQAECDMIYARLTKITPTLKLVPSSGGGNNDSIGDGIVKLQILKDELDTEIDRYCNLKREINAVIANVRNDRYRQVLHNRYVLFKTWEQIAVEMGCTYQWVNELHKRALRVVDRMIFPEKSWKS